LRRNRIKEIVDENWTNPVRKNRDLKVFDEFAFLIFNA
jgi:hypothetical protein